MKRKEKSLERWKLTIEVSTSITLLALGPGGTDLERGYGDVRPWRPPFHASPAARKGPISSKRVSSQDPFWENLESLASTASIFTQIWKFSAHKPPYFEIFRSQAPISEANVSSQAPHFGNPGRTPSERNSHRRRPFTLCHHLPTVGAKSDA